MEKMVSTSRKFSFVRMFPNVSECCFFVFPCRYEGQDIESVPLSSCLHLCKNAYSHQRCSTKMKQGGISMVMEFLNREPFLLGLAIGVIAVAAIIFHYKSREALLRECVEREKAALEKGAMQQQQIIEGMNQNKKMGRDNPNRIYDLQCRFVSDCDVDIRSRQTVGWHAYRDVYQHVESFLIEWSGNKYYLWAEVGLGGFLEATSSEEEKEKRAFNSFNSKRADFLIANWKREPVAVIEYNGSGHGTDEKTLKRDKVKQLTLEKAGVPLIVIRPDESEEALLEKISQVLSKEDRRIEENKKN